MFNRPDRKTERIRYSLLRGIYQDNLLMLGREPRASRYAGFLYVLKQSFAGLCVFSLLIFVNSSRLDPAVPNGPADLHQGTTSAFLPSHPAGFELSEYNAFLTKQNFPYSELFNLKVRTIVIDPGHGGNDSGAVGINGTKEKDITLDISMRLRERLKKYANYQIYMTREDDATLSLNSRIEFANRHNADVFVSIHVNAVPNKPINIIETYYFGNFTDQETYQLAERENSGSQYSLADFRAIIQKVGNTLKLHESKMLATSIQQSLFRNIRMQNEEILDYGIKTAPFVVLLGVDVPSVLTEISCLSNASEEEKLNDASYREQISRFLEDGILDYLDMRIRKGDFVHEAKRAG